MEYTLIFFEFTHAKAPIQVVVLAMQVWNQHRSRGKFAHFKPAGEAMHYLGHTDDSMMEVLEAELTARLVPFKRITEEQLPQDKRRVLRALRSAGQLG